MAQYLSDTTIGNECAAAFLLSNLSRSSLSCQQVILIPGNIEAPWRSTLERAARDQHAQAIVAPPWDLLPALLTLTMSMNSSLIGLTAGSSIFVTGQMIDACGRLLAQRGVDFVRGVGFPEGAIPLVVTPNVVRRASDEKGIDDPLGAIARVLPMFRGEFVPAPPRFQAPDIRLALDSLHRSSEVAAIGRKLDASGGSLTPTAFLNETRRRHRIRLRNAFRLFERRGTATCPQNTTSMKIMCIGMRSEKVSGGDTSLLNLLAGVDRTRFSLLLATPKPTGQIVDVARANRHHVVAIPSLEWPVDSVNVVSALLPDAMRLARVGRKHEVGLIYANNTTVCQVAAACAFMSDLPLVARVLDTLSREFIEQSFLFAADIVSVPSRFIADHCVELGVPRERIRVVHEGPGPDWFEPLNAPLDLHAKFGIPSDSPLIGIACRLDDPKKALASAVEAALLIRSDRPDARILIFGKSAAGRTAHQARLEHSVDKFGLTGYIQFAGFVEDMRAVFAELDILMHPAPREPFGFVLLEAMASGLPIVAIRGGGTTEMIDDGEHGLLLDRPDPRLLATAVLRLIGDTTLRARLGRAALNHVKTNFSSERFVRQTQSIFEEARYSRASQPPIAAVSRRECGSRS